MLLSHKTPEGNFMPQGDIVKPGGVLEIALRVPDPVQGKSGLGHSSVYEYLKTGRN